MDRFRQKGKKEKPLKYVDKDNSTNSFITDVKSIRENIKIKEILKTVKMNSSMRIKAPRGSKVMNNKYFNDNEDALNQELTSGASEGNCKITSATNPDVILHTDKQNNENTSEIEIMLDHLDSNKLETNNEGGDNTAENKIYTDIGIDRNETEATKSDNELSKDDDPLGNPPTPDLKKILNRQLSSRERKLSLDHTLLSRREGLSQSELDLHSIGKSPLERKSSFFRKKMDSFFKNTTEIFKKQSLGSKPTQIQRRGSISVSLHSLSEKTPSYSALMKNEQGSTRSLQSTTSTVGRSTSSLSASQGAQAGSDAGSLVGSQPLLSASQPLADATSDSVNSISDACAQDALLNARAISMSSGLDSAHTTRTRKSANRSNRVTWVASEGLAHYFRRMIQDEKSKEMQVCHSYSDFTTIPENELCTPVRERSRRLSYQRAVSGEDPAPSRQDSSNLRRRHLIPENSELTENTYKSYYFEEEASDEGEGTLAFKVKKAISNKRNNSIDSFFEKPKKKKKSNKKCSTVGQASGEGIAYINSNEDDSAYASHLIKIQVLDTQKIKNIAPAEQWKQADVLLKYYVHSEDDANLQSVRDVIYSVTKQIASKRDCVKYFIEHDKKL